MMGYGNELSPYLGAPWIKTARHLIAGEVEDDRDGDGRSDDPEHPGRDIRARSSKKGGKKGKKGGKPGDGLPEPRLPPNGTHSQL
jgi:acid phosphatase